MTRPGNIDFLDINVNIIQQALAWHISVAYINHEPQGIIISSDNLNSVDEHINRKNSIYARTKPDIKMRTTREACLSHPYPALVFGQGI